ncbi:MAG: hypothetical protein H0U64_00860 [Gemmatimonadaceae bacterium]|nr:hypothetical protein [Gemmatimonadaceae bacterium]
MNEEMIDPEKLSALDAEVSKLPRSVQPPDVWKNIRETIQSESITPIGATPARADIRFWQKPGFMLAATVALIASTSATTIIALREDRAPSSPLPASAASAAGAPASFVQFAAKENNYIQTASQLQSLVESDRSTLSPETIAKLKKSIAIIDAAILEAREALAADPANKDLIDMLSSSYDKKLDLLRRSAAMGRT